MVNYVRWNGKTTYKVSVIVPVYNVSRYLERCVNSIINQSYKNLEVLLIDDGSTDDSGRICDAYLKMDERIYVIHQKNMGLSGARNTGLNNCTGKYVFFCDSDDYLADNAIEILIRTALNNRCDVVACDYYVDCDGVITKKSTKGLYPILNNKEQMIEHFTLANHGGPAVWTKLFKRSVLSDIYFDVGKLYEDAFFMLKWIKNTGRVGTVNECLYYYYRRKNSITLSQFSKRDYDHIEAWEKNYQIIQKEFPECKDVMLYRLIVTYRKILERVSLMDTSGKYKKDREKLIKDNLKLLPKVLVNKYGGVLDVVAVVLLCVNPNLYSFLKKKYLEN